MKPEINLPAGTVSLESELVPAVRRLLGKGLSSTFMQSCVRIGEFTPYSGGLKADLVGGFTLHVNAVLKLGGRELRANAALMNAVNQHRPGTFAEVLEAVPLDGKRWLMMMAQLRKFDTLFDLVFNRETTQAALIKVLDKTFVGLAAVHKTSQKLSGFVNTQNPYTPRIRGKLDAVLVGEPALAPMFHKSGQVLGIDCPPLNDLLDRLEAWLNVNMPSVPKVLIHGDPHLRNVMVRRYGNGFAVRFIDPNPDYGYTDAVYDFGKMLHYTEAVGWAQAQPDACRGIWYEGGDQWKLDAELRTTLQAPEHRRAFLEKTILERIAGLDWAQDSSWRARLHIARASAHLGLLARFSDDAAGDARHFVLAHAVKALADWHAEIT